MHQENQLKREVSDQELPEESQETNPSRLIAFENVAKKAQKWLEDHFQGLPQQEAEPNEETKTERISSTLKVALAKTGEFFGLHLPIDVPAYLAQRFYFKPREREAIVDTLREKPADDALSAIEERINASKHLTPEEATELLNDVWGLSDDELRALDWQSLVESETLGTEWSLESETQLSANFIKNVEAIVEKHIQTKHSGKKLLTDAILTALVLKGGKLLKPIGALSQKIYYSIKGIKAIKLGKAGAGEIKDVWSDDESEPPIVAK
jgi:hypothetical protein